MKITRTDNNPWLARFALVTALATVCLIGIGGLVTSHGAGLAVPDWPTTYGYNMFAFPISQWVGGIFYEHSHRLVASGVGFLTTILAVWMWLKEERRWLRWLGVIAFFAVSIQGVLGGLRVTMLKQELGIFHAALAQLFLTLLFAISFFLSRSWKRLLQARAGFHVSTALRRALVVSAVLIFLQLILGATMRHQHAGLAVPDFPLAYGELWPRTDDAFLTRINAARHDTREYNDITAGQIYLHMAHRGMAVVLLVVAGVTTMLARKGQSRLLARFVTIWFGLIISQAGLGAYTVLSNKAADVATLHVVCGALSLAGASLLAASAFAARACLSEQPDYVIQAQSAATA